MLRLTLSGYYLAESLFVGQQRFDIQNRSVVQGFKISHLHSLTFDRKNLHYMESDGVRTIRRARAEYSALGIFEVVARMYPQDVTLRPIKPRQHDHAITWM